MKSVLITIAILTLTTTVHAQNEDYIITSKNDTVYGQIKIYNYQGQKIQLKKGKSKDSYSPYELKEIGLNSAIHHPLKIQGRYQMAKLIKSGYLSLYKFALDPNAQAVTFDTPILIKSTKEQLIIPNKGFRKEASEFLKDCELVVSKLETKEYKKSNVNNMVTDYNTCIDENTKLMAKTIEAQKVSNQKIIDFEFIKENILVSNKIQNKADVVDMLIDIQSKIETNKVIPNYLIKLLKENLSKDIELLEMLNLLLK